ncbi:MAG: LytTR family DNA-binding domain-containing protein [Defluviitaleaceae bacterium]|nr:LytTR family DNA-binding domain-containing protein [Defluviitaleaceae bacterium]
MLSVFLFGNNRSFIEFVIKSIHTHVELKKLDMEISLCTSNPERIITFIEGTQTNGLYFLELEEGEWDNPDTKGLETARLIRKHDPRGFIVFIATSPDFLPLTFKYKLEALAYIQKSDDTTVRQQICECIDDAYDKHVSRAQSGNFIFKEQSGSRISCAFDDILFFETESSSSKLIILHTQKRRYKFYSTMNEIIKELPVGLFFRSHKSFVINVGHLPKDSASDLRKGKDSVIMPNGEICYISARRKGGLLKLLESSA